MRLLWSKDKTAVVLVAETPSEMAIAEIIVADMQAYRYAVTKKGERIVGAKYTIVPEESREWPLKSQRQI